MFIYLQVPADVQPAEPARSTSSKGAKLRKPVSFKPADPAKAAATAKKRDEQRKALMQARRNLTANKADNSQEAPIEIYAPPMRKDSEKSTSSWSLNRGWEIIAIWISPLVFLF